MGPEVQDFSLAPQYMGTLHSTLHAITRHYNATEQEVLQVLTASRYLNLAKSANTSARRPLLFKIFQYAAGVKQPNLRLTKWCPSPTSINLPLSTWGFRLFSALAGVPSTTYHRPTDGRALYDVWVSRYGSRSAVAEIVVAPSQLPEEERKEREETLREMGKKNRVCFSSSLLTASHRVRDGHYRKACDRQCSQIHPDKDPVSVGLGRKSHAPCDWRAASNSMETSLYGKVCLFDLFLSPTLTSQSFLLRGLLSLPEVYPPESLPDNMRAVDAERFLASTPGIGMTDSHVRSFYQKHLDQLPQIMADIRKHDKDAGDDAAMERQALQLLENSEVNITEGDADTENASDEGDRDRDIVLHTDGAPFRWPSKYCLLSIDGVLYENDHDTVPFTFVKFKNQGQ